MYRYLSRTCKSTPFCGLCENYLPFWDGPSAKPLLSHRRLQSSRWQRLGSARLVLKRQSRQTPSRSRAKPSRGNTTSKRESLVGARRC